MAVFGLALLATLFMFVKTPTSFIPSEDQGYFIVLLQAPEGTSLSTETSHCAKSRSDHSEPAASALYVRRGRL